MLWTQPSDVPRTSENGSGVSKAQETAAACIRQTDRCAIFRMRCTDDAGFSLNTGQTRCGACQFTDSVGVDTRF